MTKRGTVPVVDMSAWLSLGTSIGTGWFAAAPSIASGLLDHHPIGLISAFRFDAYIASSALCAFV